MSSTAEEVIATVFFIGVAVLIVIGLITGQMKHQERIEECNDRGGTYLSYGCVSNDILIPLETVRYAA